MALLTLILAVVSATPTSLEALLAQHFHNVDRSEFRGLVRRMHESAISSLDAPSTPELQRPDVQRVLKMVGHIVSQDPGPAASAMMQDVLHAVMSIKPTTGFGKTGSLSSSNKAAYGPPRQSANTYDDTFSQPSSFPLLRRMVLGALLAQRLASQHAWSEEESSTALQTVRHLLLLHVSGVAARPAIQFMHVSKSAGTSICQAAVANGCR